MLGDLFVLRAAEDPEVPAEVKGDDE